MKTTALQKKFNHATQIIVMCKDLFELVDGPRKKKNTPVRKNTPVKAPAPPPPPPPPPMKLNKKPPSPKKAAVVNARASLINALKSDPKFIKMKQKLNQNAKK